MLEAAYLLADKNEIQQTVFRGVFGLLLCGYFLLVETISPEFIPNSDLYAVPFWLLLTFLVVGGWVYLDQEPHRLRQLVSIASDNLILSFGFYLNFEVMVPFLCVYLMLGMSAGFRYGASYLAFSAGVGTVGFVSAMTHTNLSVDHIFVLAGMLGVLVAVPAHCFGMFLKETRRNRVNTMQRKALSVALAQINQRLGAPLKGASSIINLLYSTPINKDQEKYLRTLSVSVNGMMDAINNSDGLLSYEDMRHQESRFDARSLFNDVAQSLKPKADSIKTRIQVGIAAEIPMVLVGNALLLRRVLTGLAENALNFTREGEILITAGCVDIDTKNSKCRMRVEIKDSGVGMSDSMRDEMFRIGSNTEHEIEYSYNRLANIIAKQIVEYMGGDIGLDSKVGMGSTFWFEIPVGYVMDIYGDKPVSQSCDKEILLITNTDERDPIIERKLASWNLEVTAANGLTQGTSMIAQRVNNPFAGIIVDHRFVPGKGAEYFAETIKAENPYADLPFIFIDQGEVSNERRNFLVNRGFATVLGSPVNWTLLYSAIVSILNGNNGHSETSEQAGVVRFIPKLMEAQTMKTPLSVLITFTEVELAKKLERCIRSLGHRPFYIEDEDSLIDIEENQAFDMAFVEMPGPDARGVERLRIIHEISMNRHIAVHVYCSEDAELQQVEAMCSDYDINQVVLKKNLIDSVEKIIKQTQDYLEKASDKKRPGNGGRQVLNENVLSEIEKEGCSPDYVDKNIQSFLEDARLLIDEIDRGIKIKDMGVVQSAARALKGCASSIGAEQMEDRLNISLASSSSLDNDFLADIKSNYSDVKRQLVVRKKAN